MTTDPQGNQTTYTYDAKGNMLTKTKPDGRTITYTYDANNRLLQRTYPDNTVNIFQYDQIREGTAPFYFLTSLLKIKGAVPNYHRNALIVRHHSQKKGDLAMKILIKILALIGFVNIVFPVSLGFAKVLPYSLKKMVKEADWVIIGTVTEIRKTNIKNEEYGYEHDVTIKINEIMKGSSISSIDVRYFPTLSTEPDFSVNERAIFFIKQWKGKNVIVQGYAGKVSIANEHVQIISIKDEAPTQDLTKFLDKIKALVGMVKKEIGGRS